MNTPHRGDRRWATAWSPEQISRRLVVDFPDDEGTRISHEAIYIQGRGALKRELVACLRTGRALRKPRERSRNKPQGHVTADVVLSGWPAEAEDRAVPGHWEGDLIIGLNRSAIGTVVERSSRYTLLVHLRSGTSLHVERPVPESGMANPTWWTETPREHLVRLARVVAHSAHSSRARLPGGSVPGRRAVANGRGTST